MKIFHRSPGWNLSERYWNEKMFYRIKYFLVKKKVNKFLNKSENKLILERIATLWAQWLQLQKDVCYSCIRTSLDLMTQEVLHYLSEKHPNHSIFSTSAETFCFWKNNNIDNNYWDEAESTQIMDMLQEYMFDKLNYRPCELTDTNLENMCIDNVSYL